MKSHCLTDRCDYLLNQTPVGSHTSKVIRVAQIELDMLTKTKQKFGVYGRSDSS